MQACGDAFAQHCPLSAANLSVRVDNGILPVNGAAIDSRLKLVFLRSMSDSNDAKLWRPVGEADGGGQPTPNLSDLEHRLESGRILKRSSGNMKYLLSTFLKLFFEN